MTIERIGTIRWATTAGEVRYEVWRELIVVGSGVPASSSTRTWRASATPILPHPNPHGAYGASSGPISAMIASGFPSEVVDELTEALAEDGEL